MPPLQDASYKTRTQLRHQAELVLLTNYLRKNFNIIHK